MSNTHEIPGLRCVACSQKIAQATDPTFTQREPKPGDWLVCAYCGFVGVMTDDHAMRRPTGPEAIQMKSSAQFMIEIRAVRRAMRGLHQRN